VLVSLILTMSLLTTLVACISPIPLLTPVVTCYATEDAVQIVNPFIKILNHT
jgi:hypothetical protein